jgi:hypothetical protein
MATPSQLRAPGGAPAMHRNSHRGLISDDTNSFARVVHNARRKPCAHNQLRTPTTTPRPAAAAAGKINSSTTHLRNLVVVSASRPVTGRFGFARHIGVDSPIDFPRRLRGASTLRSVRFPRLCCDERRAGFRLGYASGGGVVVGVVVGNASENAKNRISCGQQKSGRNRMHVGRSTVESTGAARLPRSRSCGFRIQEGVCHD